MASERLVSCGHDKTVRVWNPREGKCESVMRGHGAIIVAMAKLGETGMVATIAEDMMRRLRDA